MTNSGRGAPACRAMAYRPASGRPTSWVCAPPVMVLSSQSSFAADEAFFDLTLDAAFGFLAAALGLAAKVLASPDFDAAFLAAVPAGFLAGADFAFLALPPL